MKIRYEDFEEEFETKKPMKKKKKNESIEDRKDQKRYKKSHRIHKDKFFQETDGCCDETDGYYED